MSNPVLVIGNKAYSSWSLRPWLLMRQAGIGFDEIRVSLYESGAKQKILQYSAAGKVPVLQDDNLTVWDSLAICEYLAEKHPKKQLWPPEAAARAHARSVSAEMHSGFTNVRSQMPMNVRREIPGRANTPEVAAELARIEAIWNDCRGRHGAHGRFLFGAFSIADAMYAPVVSRLRTYGVAFDGAAGQYASVIHELPAMQEWIAGAHAETEVNPQYES
ncbi:MAG TPA: glutathione S-transferase family protein [Burkholderiales bacterium]|nr:glutathione S-transferase family protein [Burkholderiales bacterium]